MLDFFGQRKDVALCSEHERGKTLDSGGLENGVHWVTFYFIFIYFLIFWPHRLACGILVPRLGIEPASPALEAQSLS